MRFVPDGALIHPAVGDNRVSDGIPHANPGTPMWNFLELCRGKVHPKWDPVEQHLVWFINHTFPVPWDPLKRGKKDVARITQTELRHYAYKIPGIRPDWCVDIPSMQDHVTYQADQRAQRLQAKGKKVYFRGKDVPHGAGFLDALTIGDRHMRFCVTNPTQDIRVDELLADADFQRFWKEVDWTREPGVCIQYSKSDPLGSARIDAGKLFKVDIRFLPVFVDPLMHVNYQHLGMGLDYAALSIVQGDSCTLPRRLQLIRPLGFGLFLRLEKEHYFKLAWTCSHTTNENGGWCIIGDKLLCGGPRHEHNQAFFTTLGNWGKQRPITWSEHLCKEPFKVVYHYKGDWAVAMNLWIHRLMGCDVQFETTGCVTTRKNVSGRCALALYQKPHGSDKLVLHWKSPLFPRLKWDPARLDEPAYFEKFEDIKGKYGVDLDNLPQRHIDDPGNNPIPMVLSLTHEERLKMELGVPCIQCDESLWWGTIICPYCRATQP